MLRKGTLAHNPFRVGKCYQDECEDFVKAAKWYRKAADQDHAEVQNHLGYHLEKGEGVAEDTPEAVEWYKKARRGAGLCKRTA